MYVLSWRSLRLGGLNQMLNRQDAKDAQLKPSSLFSSTLLNKLFCSSIRSLIMPNDDPSVIPPPAAIDPDELRALIAALLPELLAQAIRDAGGSVPGTTEH
jgi:hypothetical protein